MAPNEIENNFIDGLQQLVNVAEVTLKALHEEFYLRAEMLKSAETSDGVLADAGYLLRTIEDLMDEGRKEAKQRKELVGRILAARIMTRGLTGGGDGKVRGQLCTAIPDVKMRPSVPKAGSPDYINLCTHFGVNEEAIKAGLFAPHYVRFTDYLTSNAESGAASPPGVKTIPDVRCTFIKKRT